MRCKPAADGGLGYYFEPPGRDVAAGCPVSFTALGRDRDVAIKTVEDDLLPRLYAWRQGATIIELPPQSAVGTIGWLLDKYFKTDRFKVDLSTSSQNTYLWYGQTIRKLQFSRKPGRFFTETRLSDIDEAFADAVFKALRENTRAYTAHSEVPEDGKPLRASRARKAPPGTATAKRCIELLRVAHNVMRRVESKTVPLGNPWSRMGIRYKQTPSRAASELEMSAAVNAADDLMLPSIAALILLEWELAVRREHACYMVVADYRPASHPNEVFIFDRKVNEYVWRPLFDHDGTPLYPLLVPRLDQLVQGRSADEPLFAREYGNGHVNPAGWIGVDQKTWSLNKMFRAVRRHAGLDEEISLRSFRTGGLTEAGASGLSESELLAVSLHKEPSTLERYNRYSAEKIINGRAKINSKRLKQVDRFGPKQSLGEFIKPQTVVPFRRKCDFEVLDWGKPSEKPFWLQDRAFDAIRSVLPPEPVGRKRADDRQVISGVIDCMRRGGRNWLHAPKIYGPYRKLYRRYVDWMRDGVWPKILDRLRDGA